MISPSDFRAACDALCRDFGLSETSGRRSDAHAVAVHGFAGDPHTWGAGRDATGLKLDQHEAFRVQAHEVGVLALFEADHAHLQPWGWPAGPVVAAPDPAWEGQHG